MKTPKLPKHIANQLRTLIAAGGYIARDGNRLLIEGPPNADSIISGLRENIGALTSLILPSVTEEEAAVVRGLLADAGVTITYITDPASAHLTVVEICACKPKIVGLDFETEVLAKFRQPIPIKFNQDGNVAARQSRDGVAGLALDPYRSKVRLVQAWAGNTECYVFDMRLVSWEHIAPLFTLPLAIFNATFEVKRLLYEAGIEPTGRLYDVMTAHWLTDGVRPSLGDAVTINYNIKIPKTLGASDWAADKLSIHQLEYAALDAVLCRLLWLTQQSELFDDIDKQCQQVCDAVIPAIARIELAGMPIDIKAHLAQIKQWEEDLTEAKKALCTIAQGKDLLRPTGLQQYLEEILEDEALEAWPLTESGKLSTTHQQLQLNAHLPAIDELLKVRGLEKLINSFGLKLIDAINPVTGRLHASFLIAGASTSRFAASSPNLQQMPKGKRKTFRQIFKAPAGKIIMALDYSQIELRAVAELISDWFGTNSILRQSFAAGLDAHNATAMAMIGKSDPKDITKDERQLAKPCNFGLLYRMENYGFYNYLRANFTPEITFDQACELKQKFFAGYPDLARWQDEYTQTCRKQGYTQTVAGRRWRWEWRAQAADELDEDEPFFSDKLSGFNGSYAVNHPVQGSSAEVMMIALTRLDEALRNEPAEIIATIHDEVVMLVSDDPETIDRVGMIAQKEMVSAFVDVFPDAPTINLVDPMVGPTWGNLKPLKEWFEEYEQSIAAE